MRVMAVVISAAICTVPLAPAQAAKVDTVKLTLPKNKTEVAATMKASVLVNPAGKRTVKIQTSSDTTTWTTVGKAKTDSSGSAKVGFTTYKDGKYKVRAVAGDAKSKPAALKSDYSSFGGPPKDKLAPMKPDSLTISKSAQGDFQLGEFRVSVVPGSGAKVEAVDAAGRVVWSSDPGKAFVGASRSTLRWFQRSKAGAFWPQVSRSATLTAQTIASAKQNGETLTIRGLLSGDGKQTHYTVTLAPKLQSADVKSLQLGVTFQPKKSEVEPNTVLVTSGRATNTGVHGFGNQYQKFDLSGQLLPLLVQEQGVTRGEQPAADVVDATIWGAGNLKTTYGGWPTYVTAQNRSFTMTDSLASGALAVADMRRAKQIGVESFSKTFTATMVARDTPADLVRARAAGTALPPLADWITKGAVLGLQGGTDKVRQVVSDMQAAGTKISAVWLQDWVGKRVTGFGEQLWWTWQLDKKTYPNWDQMVADFDAQGIKVMTYVNPFVINQSTVNGTPIRNFYAEAAQKGYLVKNQRGKPYVVETVGFPTGLVDLTNPAARDWYAQIISEFVLGVGASGFMADFGEYLPMDSVLFKGSAPRQHSRWPQLWAQTVRQACAQAGKPECVAFFRSSYLGSSKSVPLMWAGDQMVNYAQEDGMASAVQGMLAGGVSGLPLWHSDIGGYTSLNVGIENFLRPPQLNARWAEMQAFGPVMRTHETNRPRLNQQVYDTPDTRAQFARASQIYAALRDYRASVIQEAVSTGVPAMRHAWLVYPGTAAAAQDLQFFLGDHLLVAPVYAENATTVKVVFPPGDWKHVLTGAVYSGEATVDAPIGTPAAFVKVGDPVGDQILAGLRAAGL